MNPHIRFAAAALALTLSATLATAHIFWIQPSAFVARPGDILKFQLRVGDDFPGEIVPRNESKIEKFIVVGPKPDTEQPALGRDGDPTAAMYRPTDPGTYLIAYRSKPTPVTLEAKKFEDYLREKGLEKIIEARAKSGRASEPGREIFSRSAKAVFIAGNAPTDGVATRNLGLRVEIVPRTNPAALAPGGVLPLTVFSQGQPLADALVQATNASHPEDRLLIRTDSSGHVSLRLAHAGMWVIDTVDIFPAPKASGADWESVWASVAFEIPSTSPEQANRQNPVRP